MYAIFPVLIQPDWRDVNLPISRRRVSLLGLRNTAWAGHIVLKTLPESGVRSSPPRGESGYVSRNEAATCQ